MRTELDRIRERASRPRFVRHQDHKDIDALLARLETAERALSEVARDADALSPGEIRDAARNALKLVQS